MRMEKEFIGCEQAIFAGGCFWGVENLMMKYWPGVRSIECGYIGGHKDNPTYPEVKAHTTGHAEAVRIFFDPHMVDFETLAKLFFEIHDPTQLDRQGIDVGDQYRSEIFHTSPEQEKTAWKLIEVLKSKGYDVVTKVTPATTFWRAEEYHQKYFDKNGGEPDCHRYEKKF